MTEYMFRGFTKYPDDAGAVPMFERIEEFLNYHAKEGWRVIWFDRKETGATYTVNTLFEREGERK